MFRVYILLLICSVYGLLKNQIVTRLETPALGLPHEYAKVTRNCSMSVKRLKQLMDEEDAIWFMLNAMD
jgi:hypothetical protein